MKKFLLKHIWFSNPNSKKYFLAEIHLPIVFFSLSSSPKTRKHFLAQKQDLAKIYPWHFESHIFCDYTCLLLPLLQQLTIIPCLGSLFLNTWNFNKKLFLFEKSSWCVTTFSPSVYLKNLKRNLMLKTFGVLKTFVKKNEFSGNQPLIE